MAVPDASGARRGLVDPGSQRDLRHDGGAARAVRDRGGVRRGDGRSRAHHAGLARADDARAAAGRRVALAAGVALGAARRRADRAGAARAGASCRCPGGAHVRDDRGVLADRDPWPPADRRRAAHLRRGGDRPRPDRRAGVGGGGRLAAHRRSRQLRSALGARDHRTRVRHDRHRRRERRAGGGRGGAARASGDRGRRRARETRTPSGGRRSSRPSCCATAASADQDELRAFCAGRLAPYKVPKAISFAPRLPRTASGKLLRRELR